MGDSGAVCPYQDGRSRRLASMARGGWEGVRARVGAWYMVVPGEGG